MSARGFTLFEVLAALAVVGIGMLAMMGAAGHFTRQSAELRERTIAHWVAGNQLAELRLERAFPEPGTRSGTVDMAGQRWRWTVLVSPAPGEDDLRRIDVAVAPAARPDTRAALVTGFVGRVSASGGDDG